MSSTASAIGIETFERPINKTLLLLTMCILTTLIVDPSAIHVVMSAISEAYLAVTTFVAATLLLFFSIEKLFKFDLSTVLARSGRWQVLLAAALGSLPGCGGAIIVVTRYVSGNLSFGSLLATLTATMGDAAFLLIAKEPLTGMIIIALSFFVGTLTGLITDLIHGPDFMRPKHEESAKDLQPNKVLADNRGLSIKLLDRFWMILIVPGIVMGFALAFQYDLDALLGFESVSSPATIWGFVGGSLCFSMWALPRIFTQIPTRQVHENGIIGRTISDTNFVTGWVVIAFLMFELMVHFANFDLSTVFSPMAAFTPLIAILIGFLPGCGPQMLITTMYLSGFIPLSAQIGNAISNDGDALFPAIAMAPKAAIVATIYSALPALIVAYGWYFLVENS